MSISTNSKNRSNDDEIDLIPLIQALWANKLTVLAAAFAGAVISLSIYLTSAEEWTASTYITKSSLYNLYKELNESEVAPDNSPQQVRLQIYSSIQDDIFYTAMGVMASQSITLKESAPKTGKNEAVLYIASVTAPTAEQAEFQLKTVMDTANNQSIALNLPAQASKNSLRAFNVLDETKVTGNKNKNNTKPAALGAFLGLILGGAFVIGRFLIRKHKKPNHA